MTATGRALRAALRALDSAPSDARRLLRAFEARRHEAHAAERVAAGLIAFDARLYDDALDWLQEVGRLDDPLATGALTQAASLAQQVGWNHRALALMDARQALQPDHAPTRQRRAGLLAQARNLEDAAAVLAEGPAGGGGALLRAEVLVQLRDPDAAAAVAEAAALSDDPVLVAALWGRLGEHRRALAALGDGADLAPVRALTLLRAGQYAEAQECAGRAQGPLAAMVRGAVLLAQGPPLFAVGDAEEALPQLDAALAGAPHLGEARIWRAEAHIRLGDDAAALADLEEGVVQSGGYVLAARLLRYLLEVRADGVGAVDGPLQRVLEPLAPLIPSRGGRRVNAGILEELGPGLRELGFGDAELTQLTRASGVESVVPVILTRLGGDRSPRGPDSPRAQARRTLELIRTMSPERALERFGRLDLAGSSMGVVHRGELRLWMGDWEGAVADFEESLAMNRHTRWGWIGQLGARGLGGDPERALAVGAKGVAVMGGYGPSHYVYRAEAARLLGRVDAARADLELAVELNPTRLGAWVTLALLVAEQGDGARLQSLMAHLAPRAAGHLARAARETGTDLAMLWPDGGGVGADPQALRPLLTRAHAMMRGNRSSSCLTWFTSDGELRLTHRPRANAPNDPSRIEASTRRRRAANLLDVSARSSRG